MDSGLQVAHGVFLHYDGSVHLSCVTTTEKAAIHEDTSRKDRVASDNLFCCIVYFVELEFRKWMLNFNIYYSTITK